MATDTINYDMRFAFFVGDDFIERAGSRDEIG